MKQTIQNVVKRLLLALPFQFFNKSLKSKDLFNKSQLEHKSAPAGILVPLLSAIVHSAFFCSFCRGFTFKARSSHNWLKSFLKHHFKYKHSFILNRKQEKLKRISCQTAGEYKKMAGPQTPLNDKRAQVDFGLLTNPLQNYHYLVVTKTNEKSQSLTTD